MSNKFVEIVSNCLLLLTFTGNGTNSYYHGYDQTMVDTQKTTTLNVATLANAFCRTSLVNTDF